MSTLAVSTITDTSGGNTATINSFTPTESNMAGRNRIINGDMRIDQRNAGASVTNTTGFIYSVDRFGFQGSIATKFTVQQSTTAPAGFTNSLLCTSSAATTPGASDYFYIAQKVEGLNLADLGWGTASAATVTLSFRVYSSLTGTFGGSLINSGFNRSYPFTYTISSANTWTTISVTVAGDTSGTWLTTNGVGVTVLFGLGVGSTYSGAAGAWAGNVYYGAAGATSVVGTSGATFYITGVQLEKGSTATDFEYVDYGRQLQMCQRYYQVAGNGAGWVNSAVGSSIFVSFFAPMRANPTTSLFNGTNTFLDSGVAQRNITGISSITTEGSPTLGAKMDITHASTTTGKTALTHSGAFAFSAEL
jgi:hypothetical protein